MVIKRCDWFLLRWLLLEQLLLKQLLLRWLLLERLLLRWLLLLQRFPSCLNFIFVNFELVSKFQHNVTSIVKWGYQDNFKPVYFFTERFRARKKHQNAKQATFTLLEVCAREKLLPQLFSVCLILFCWFIFACDVFLCALNLFVKKNKQA